MPYDKLFGRVFLVKDIVFVGVAGGTGSGKTTVARKILEDFNDGDAVIIEQDSYYKELHGMSIEERAKVNFDHPDSLDFDLLVSHLNSLRNGETIECPVYDFTQHARKDESKLIKPVRIVVVEGILIFAVSELRKLFDIKIYVDTDDDERLLRRIERDMNERARSFDSIKEQYLKTVKPMFLKFSEPSKRYADIIIPRGGENLVGINMVKAKLNEILS
jgi:uridine kinase